MSEHKKEISDNSHKHGNILRINCTVEWSIHDHTSVISGTLVAIVCVDVLILYYMTRVTAFVK